MNPGLVVNLRAGMVHDGEPSERCNSDAIPRRFRRRFDSLEQLAGLEEPRRGWRWCRWCWPEGTPR